MVRINVNPQTVARAVQVKVEEKIENLKANADSIAVEVLRTLERRCPDPGTEYDIIMRGIERQYSLIPIGADPDGRIRFIRAPGMWLREAIYDARNYEVNAQSFTLNFGKISFLDSHTKYSWQNKNGQVNESKTGVWQNFEYGSGPNTVTPRGAGSKRQYYLAPDQNTRVPSMQKTYPAFLIYTGFPRAKFVALCREAIKKAP